MRQYDFKGATEATVARPFVDLLRAKGLSIESTRAGKSDEPDILCFDADRNLIAGIEVTAAFYSRSDAALLRKVVMDLALEGKRQTVMSTSDIGASDLPPGVIRHPDARLALGLQRAMESHCLRRYDATLPTYLILDASWAPTSTSADAATILAALSKPVECPYADVYLALTRNWSSEREFFRL